VRINSDQANASTVDLLATVKDLVKDRKRVDNTELDDRIAEAGREFTLEMAKGEDADFERAGELCAVKKALEAERAAMPETARVETTQTYGEMWRGLGNSERNPWLVKYGVKVKLAKDVQSTDEGIEGHTGSGQAIHGGVSVDWSHEG
jgi:hypothetical protein